MSNPIRKLTSKGQVTLPSAWRKRIGTDTVELVDKGGVLEVRPAEIISGEEVLFDAERDNKGKGIPIDDLMKALKND
jgi:AbrB family looped-hinge helix DNA binding protein